MANDQELRSHQEWLGYLQPVGLVVSPPALHAAQAYVNRAEAVRLQTTLEELVDPGPPPCINDFPGFCRTLLGWTRRAARWRQPTARRCRTASTSRCPSTARCCRRPTPSRTATRTASG